MEDKKRNTSEENLQTDVDVNRLLEEIDELYRTEGPDSVSDLLCLLEAYSQKYGIKTCYTANTPYINTIPRSEQPVYPGNREIERRIKSINRWNAMAIVVRANRELHGIGGHISTFASCATLYEVGFDHFFKGKNDESGGDMIYFQGHSSPGIYARAFLEGRLSEKDLINFRRELSKKHKGLSSYPHPWLMPDFWEFPTVSMGLGPIMAIYQARFNKYLLDRGIKDTSKQKVWAFLGDGETDEPETLGAITLASREHLDNLIFVINCNLQRLDGPVRGNGKVIQELEAAFKGAGWNVIKVIWGDDWDPLLENDKSGLLIKRMQEVVDGQFQKYVVSDGAYIRKDFFGKYPQLLELVKDHSDEQLRKLRRGGHDPEKVYAAFKEAVEHKDSPTVILAKTIKGYGLGEAGEGRNVTHQQKKLNEDELKEFRIRFGIPISDEEITEVSFYKPPENSPEIKYLKQRREKLGGYVPQRIVKVNSLKTPPESLFEEYYTGSGEREVATTMIFVHLLSKLLKDKEIGKYIVPIVPDEARTFGMESLFRQVGIYSHPGQLYEPVDKENLLYYREAKDGAILEEGITEAGSMSSFIAAGTAYATHGINMIPFFIYYSMFGFQRIGDLIWAAGDMRTKGFLVGGTSGKTTLSGEGLQHQDGHSHVLAMPVPNLKAYDPAYAYEIAVIIKNGIYRMFEKQENIFYYLTVMNELYKMPAMPKNSEEGILKGIYKFKESEISAKQKVHLFGSGTILNEAVKAQKLLIEKFGIPTEVWSVTSYKELLMDAQECERWNMLHPGETPKVPYIRQALINEEGFFVAASDYMKILPDSISRWIPGDIITLGTDGFGRSDGRKELRDFFEVDERYITLAALNLMLKHKKIKSSFVKQVIKEFGIDSEKPNPVRM